MKMQQVIEQLVLDFGPKDRDMTAVVAAVMKFMPNKDVPDETFRKVKGIGNALKTAGVPK